MPTADEQATSSTSQKRSSSSEHTLNGGAKDANPNREKSVNDDNGKFDKDENVGDYPEKKGQCNDDNLADLYSNEETKRTQALWAIITPVGFWGPALAKTRKWIFIHWAGTILILMVFILTVLGMYWTVLFNVEQNLEALTIGVFSFDGQFAPYVGTTPFVGRAVIQATETAGREPGHLSFITQSPAMYNGDPMAVRLAVFDQHLWAAIIVNNNATALLQDAVRTGNANYDPLGASQIIYNQARDEDTYANYITPVLHELQVEI